AAFDYTSTQAGNPALNAEECIFTTDGTGGGGILCEGTTADTNEGLIQWNPTTDKILTLPDATDTLVGRDTTDTLTNKTIDATNTVTINASDITDLNASTDITADLEEEAHASEHDSTFDLDVSGETLIFQTDSTLAGNPALAAESCVFSNDGTNGVLLCEGAADDIEGLIVWSPTTADRTLTLPDATDTLVGRDTTDTLTNKTIDATNTVTINASDITDLNVNTDITADLEEEAHASEHDGQGTAVSGETLNLSYTDTLAGNPAFNAEECVFTTDGTGGGGFLCEGTTGGNTNEQLYIFPAVDGADTTSFIAVDNLSITNLDENGLTTSGTNLRVGAGTGIAVSANAVAFDYTDAGTDPALTAEQCRFSNEGASDGGWVCEGTSADTIETRFRVTNPTSADRIVTFPNADTATAQAVTCGGTDKV
ncbi:MAG: hypothetical protein R3330_15595, partial [Saprospiraceae bacterium]|nr:hypothetical protein [Saprospiraceae bacterium]